MNNGQNYLNYKMVNSTLKAILAAREDISDYLFHFTRGSKAFETLLRILADGELKDIKRNGYICFTEAPLTALYNMFQIFDRYPEPMFAPYGVGIKKDILFDLGCRPVIYGTNDDFGKLSQCLYWRCVEYKPKVSDYTWLREWRIKANTLKLFPSGCIVITKTDYEQTLLMRDIGEDFDIDGDIDDGEFHGYVKGEFERVYKGVSMESIRNVCLLSNKELNNILDTQTIGESETQLLGYF